MPHVWWYGSHGITYPSHASEVLRGVVTVSSAISPPAEAIEKTPMTASRDKLCMVSLVRKFN
jgi:hypothetical protein